VDSYLVAVGSACWLGILTSISPCPMATNIAAITYIGKRVDRPRYVLGSGLLYTLGRTVTYVALGVLIVTSVLAVPDLSWFLQDNINQLLGPILLIVGLFLLGAFRLNFSGPGFADRLKGRVEEYGLWGAGLLGLLFALSFCPVSAAFFFGGLIPIAVEQQSTVLMPTVFGIGTALPVVVFAVLIAFGARYVGNLFDRLTVFQLWARRLTGAVFVLVGLYYCAVYLLGWDV
jgi:cytochrome c biogenesis protein CcdA